MRLCDGEFLWNSNISLAHTNLKSCIISSVIDENKVHELESMIGKSNLLSSLGKAFSGLRRELAIPVPATFAFLFFLSHHSVFWGFKGTGSWWRGVNTCPGRPEWHPGLCSDSWVAPNAWSLGLGKESGSSCWCWSPDVSGFALSLAICQQNFNQPSLPWQSVKRAEVFPETMVFIKA